MGNKSSSGEISTKGTILKKEDFNPKDDAASLKESMDGFGTNEMKIIEVLVSMSNEQRREVEASFNYTYKKDLKEELKSELRADFEKTVIALLDKPVVLIAKNLKNALQSGGSEDKLMEYFLCGDKLELKQIEKAYNEGSEKTLQGDLSECKSAVALRWLYYLKGDNKRDGSSNWDASTIVEESKTLTDETDISKSKFMEILTHKNYSHLKDVFESFKDKTGTAIEEVVDIKLKKEVATGILNLISYVEDPINYFATRLNSAFEGIGTDDSSLILLIVSRSEIDLLNIKEKYLSLYEKNLDDSINCECSGDYKRLLLAVAKTAPPEPVEKEDITEDAGSPEIEEAIPAEEEKDQPQGEEVEEVKE